MLRRAGAAAVVGSQNSWNSLIGIETKRQALFCFFNFFVVTVLPAECGVCGLMTDEYGLRTTEYGVKKIKFCMSHEVFFYFIAWKKNCISVLVLVQVLLPVVVGWYL